MEMMESRALELYEGESPAIRVEASPNKAGRLVGYAVRFNSLSKDLGGFRERILPGAFSSVLEKGVDIRALIDHDKSKLLGRTSAGTLRVGQDDRGLWFQLDLPNTQYSRDLQALVERGDVRGMSFGFNVPKGGDRFLRENNTAIREVTAADLKEITVTSIPAYTATEVTLRIDPGLSARIPSPMTAAKARRWFALLP